MLLRACFLAWRARALLAARHSAAAAMHEAPALAGGSRAAPGAESVGAACEAEDAPRAVLSVRPSPARLGPRPAAAAAQPAAAAAMPDRRGARLTLSLHNMRGSAEGSSGSSSRWTTASAELPPAVADPLPAGLEQAVPAAIPPVQQQPQKRESRPSYRQIGDLKAALLQALEPGSSPARSSAPATCVPAAPARRASTSAAAMPCAFQPLAPSQRPASAGRAEAEAPPRAPSAGVRRCLPTRQQMLAGSDSPAPWIPCSKHVSVLQGPSPAGE